jgi:hypothetical protein
VATIFSQSLSSAGDECRTASDFEPPNEAYWDLGQFGACSAAGTPYCQHDAKRMTLGMTRMPSGDVKYHTACQLPDLLSNGSHSAAEFDDGKTLIAFAHQDDDLL